MALTFKKMLGVLVIFLLAALGGLLFYAEYINAQLRQAAHERAELTDQYAIISEMRLGVNELVLAAMDAIVDKADGQISAERMQIIQDASATLDKDAAKLKALLQNDRHKAMFADIEANIPKLVQTIAVDLRREIQAGLSEEAGARLDDAIDSSGEGTAEKLAALQKEIDAEFAESRTHFAELLDHSSQTTTRSIMAVLAISVPLLLFVLLRITRSISALSANMAELAGGNLDVAVYGEGRRDEIGAMSASVAMFKRAGLEKRALDAAQKEQEIRAQQEKRQATQQLANQFEAKVLGIVQTVAAAAEELSQTANNMSGVIGNVSRKAGEVARSSQETSHNVQSVASATEEMSASVREIAQQINKSTNAVSSVMQEMQKADATSQSLEEATRKIEDIVVLIQAIAGQINLLALNATIESARAGDAGKGFAVVASEVKQLAGQTTNATNEIAGNIGNIKSVAAEVIAVLASIKQSVGHVNEIAASISAAVEEQSAVTDEIASNMGRASAGTNNIDKNIGDVSQSTGTASTAAEQTASASRQLAVDVERLRAEVEGFLREVRAG